MSSQYQSALPGARRSTSAYQAATIGKGMLVWKGMKSGV